MSADIPSHTLPIGYILNGRYRIDAVLGEGGFGITYKATDISEHPAVRLTAIKEYYPSGIATRQAKGNNPYYVTHFDGKLAVSFRKGLNRFRQEAYLLKEFQKLDSIVSILDIFDENTTTYIVMEYIEGLTIQKLVKKDGPIICSDLLSLIKPLLKDLSKIHERGLIHRDISPDNLLIGIDNRLHLIDFGSANHSNINASKTYTVILKAGYAPPEQYVPHGKIGAWTDVYGICATMFYALTGQIPTDSLQRMQSNDADRIMWETLDKVTGLEQYQKDCIMQGLSLKLQDRYPSINVFLNSFTTPTDKDVITEMPLEDIESQNSIHSKNIKKIIAAIIAICVVAGTAGIMAITNHSNTITMSNADISNEYTSDNSSHDSGTASENDSNTSTESIDANKILTMVNLSGKTVEQASEIIHKLDSNIDIQTVEEYSTVYNKGIIVSQSIREDTQFTQGDINSIVLTVSLGEESSSNEASTENTDSASQTNNSTQTGGNSETSSSGSGNSGLGNSSTTKKSSGSKKNDGYTTIHIGD